MLRRAGGGTDGTGDAFLGARLARDRCQGLEGRGMAPWVGKEHGGWRKGGLGTQTLNTWVQALVSPQ
ncbi:hypothetical protein E2C01_091471 [Portunus trituberculatus]|uniref:Uncharacterized protein n=1 Tax=Portunus trituberculatus TaxID=210409 RepID=A0A5B7JSY8_PORTR|nr:hypothetical protein [Portunus trituberculatus]